VPEPVGPNGVLVDGADNVVTVTCAVAEGAMVVYSDGVTVHELTATAPIPFGHKIARHDIPEGAIVRKYGEAIGCATRPISVGQHVHVHNVRSLRAQAERVGEVPR